MEEIWLPFIDYEDYYEVSNLGRVRSKDKVFYGGKDRHKMIRKGQLLKGAINRNNGYIQYFLQAPGRKVKAVYGHRMVALMFIPNPYNLPLINHKNEVKTDNRVENLEWCDGSYNVNYSLDLHPERKREKKLVSMEEKRRKRRERYHKLHPNAKYYNQPKQTLKEKKVRTKQTLKEKKEKQRLYYQLHREERLQYGKDYYNSHRENRLNYQKIYNKN